MLVGAGVDTTVTFPSGVVVAVTLAEVKFVVVVVVVTATPLVVVVDRAVVKGLVGVDMDPVETATSVVVAEVIKGVVVVAAIVAVVVAAVVVGIVVVAAAAVVVVSARIVVVVGSETLRGTGGVPHWTVTADHADTAHRSFISLRIFGYFSPASPHVSSLNYARSHKVSLRGRRDDMPPPPMAVRSKNRGGSTSVHGRVRSSHISGGRRWISCRQPACLCLGSCAMGQTDRRTDRAILKCPQDAGHNKLSIHLYSLMFYRLTFYPARCFMLVYIW